MKTKLYLLVILIAALLFLPACGKDKPADSEPPTVIKQAEPAVEKGAAEVQKDADEKMEKILTEMKEMKETESAH